MRQMLVFALGLVLLACLLVFIDRKLPTQHLPWRKLDVNAPIGAATGIQLTRVSLGPSETCMTLARETEGLESIPAEPKDTESVCGWTVARFMSASDTVRLSPGEVSMQCPLTLGAHIWLREINREAKARLGADIADVLHAGTYSCRRQRGNGSGQWSEHAFSNAWDITGFRLSDGRVISVLKDWNGDVARREFLRDARNKACKIFRVTLSPDYNTAHRDHFHVDMGPSRSCR